MKLFLVCIVGCLLSSATSFTAPSSESNKHTALSMTVSSIVVEPSKRDEQYAGNMAQYLVDLHDNKATFDFCGGMMFQLVLSKKLRDHLLETSADDDTKPVVAVSDATKSRMHQLDDYSQTAAADNNRIFHGREIRNVVDAAGGMGFVLQLSLADANDPEGWTDAEIAGYDGWAHDGGRDWRVGSRLEEEGFPNFLETFGPKSFALHHRFYLHYDAGNRLWLSAEDGCEGTPGGASNPVQNFFRKLL